MADWSIEQLEKHVANNEFDLEELVIVKIELGYRSTKRSLELKALVERLIRNPEPRGLA